MGTRGPGSYQESNKSSPQETSCRHESTSLGPASSLVNTVRKTHPFHTRWMISWLSMPYNQVIRGKGAAPMSSLNSLKALVLFIPRTRVLLGHFESSPVPQTPIREEELTTDLKISPSRGLNRYDYTRVRNPYHHIPKISEAFIKKSYT